MYTTVLELKKDNVGLVKQHASEWTPKDFGFHHLSGPEVPHELYSPAEVVLPPSAKKVPPASKTAAYLLL